MEDLTKEAKKYKGAEEFVAQKPDSINEFGTEFKDVNGEDVANIKPSEKIETPKSVDGLPNMFIDTKDGSANIQIKDWRSTDQGFVAQDGSDIWHFKTSEQAINFGKQYLTIMAEASNQGKDLRLSPKSNERDDINQQKNYEQRNKV